MCFFLLFSLYSSEKICLQVSVKLSNNNTNIYLYVCLTQIDPLVVNSIK